jgi:hypothetical protein
MLKLPRDQTSTLSFDLSPRVCPSDLPALSINTPCYILTFSFLSTCWIALEHCRFIKGEAGSRLWLILIARLGLKEG